jgi:hypothetical protein
MEEQEKKTLLDVIHQMQALANQCTPDEIAKILDLKIFSERFDESSVCHTFTLLLEEADFDINTTSSNFCFLGEIQTIDFVDVNGELHTITLKKLIDEKDSIESQSA